MNNDNDTTKPSTLLSSSTTLTTTSTSTVDSSATPLFVDDKTASPVVMTTFDANRHEILPPAQQLKVGHSQSAVSSFSTSCGGEIICNGKQMDADFHLFKGKATPVEPSNTDSPTDSGAKESLTEACGNGMKIAEVAPLSADALPDAGGGFNTIEKQIDNAAAIEQNPLTQALSDRFVSPKDFDLLKVIGMGAFGKVLQVRNRQTKHVLAMKVISKRILKRKSGYVENIRAERDILTRVSHHPFVVTMHCSFQTKEKLFLIMDFLAGGELFCRIGREGIFLEKTAAFYLAEIVLALDHLHTMGVLHRDLKPENILLGSDGHVCLTDFGLAKDFGPRETDQTNSNSAGTSGQQPESAQSDEEIEDSLRALTICGTQEYMAPEMLARQGYGRAADYWSLGCIAYEMLSGLPPFQRKRNEGSKDLFRKIMSEKVKMPPGASAEACKLLKGLLNRNVQTRLGTAKSTMFETGGVAGLKAQKFFVVKGGIVDWELLQKKQVPPPENLSVEGDEDLQHFHSEFTTMALPRSVLEMSHDEFYPRRVESDLFRGFSFIQKDFELPTRDEQTLKTYWEAQADGDGESVSDVASSKVDGEFNGAATANADESNLEFDKKKRPPRKRKKKKDGVAAIAAANARAAPVTGTGGMESRAPSDVGTEDDKNEVDNIKTSEATQNTNNQISASTEATAQLLTAPSKELNPQPSKSAAAKATSRLSVAPQPPTNELTLQSTKSAAQAEACLVTASKGPKPLQQHEPQQPRARNSVVPSEATVPVSNPISTQTKASAKALQAQQPRRREEDVWQVAATDKRNAGTRRSLPQQGAIAKQPALQTARLTVVTPRVQQPLAGVGARKVVATGTKQSQPKPPSLQKPSVNIVGGWAQAGASVSLGGLHQQLQQEPSVRSLETDSEPSTDWRQHAMSPRSRLRVTRQEQQVPPPVTVKVAPTGPEPPAWPSLDPRPSLSNAGNPPNSGVKKPGFKSPPQTLQGAWATRTKA
ncbi:hypothetical protein ACA910_014062 [Epithemia clementina (nom. ined.)]